MIFLHVGIVNDRRIVLGHIILKVVHLVTHLSHSDYLVGEERVDVIGALTFVADKVTVFVLDKRVALFPLKGSDEYLYVFYAPLAALFNQLLRHIKVFKIVAVCDNDKVNVICIARANATQLVVKLGVIYVKNAVIFLRGELWHRKIACKLDILHLVAEARVAMVKILVVFRVLFIKNMILYRLENRAFRACGKKLVVCHRGKEYLLICLAKAHENHVYIYVLAHQGGLVIYVALVHKHRYRIFVNKIHSQLLILIHIVNTAVSGRHDVLIYRLIARIAKDVYLQIKEESLAQNLGGAVYTINNNAAELEIFLILFCIYNKYILAVQPFYQLKQRLYAGCQRGGVYVCHVFKIKRVALF